MIYFNEFDPHAAQWLRELSREGLIPEAHVDDRSIKEVTGKDVMEYSQCHFFAGIGGWSEALRIADWPESVRLWTGSCPCQPFSSAGKGLGVDDPRHLWPDFRRLIAECRPPAVLGEQVASAAGREWLAGVRADLEELGYAVGAADLCAAGVGAPHLRQRLYWGAIRMADAERPGPKPVLGDGQHVLDGPFAGRVEATGRPGVRGRPVALADADGRHAGDGDQQRRRQQRQQPSHGGIDAVGDANGQRPCQGKCGGEAERHRCAAHADGCPHTVGDTDLPGRGKQRGAQSVRPQQSAAQLRGDSGGVGDTEGRGQPVGGDEARAWGGRHALRSGWSRFDIITCRDGKHRRIPAGAQPLVQPVVDGFPLGLADLWSEITPGFEAAYPLTPKMNGRVGLLRGAGNAIVPQVAAVFIRAFMEAAGIDRE